MSRNRVCAVGGLRRIVPFGVLVWVAAWIAWSVEIAGAAPPSGRAYELVSAQDKNGGDVMGHSARTRAARGGNALQYSSLTAFGDAHGTGIAVDYMTRRTAVGGTQGWATHALTPAQEPLSLTDLIFGGLDLRFMGEFSDDFEHGVFLAKSPLTPAPNMDNVSTLYLRDDLLTPGPGSYQLLTSCSACTPLPPFAARQPAFADASTDFGHVILESTWNLTSEAIDAGLDPGMPKLYEWDHGTLRLVGILPDGTPASSSAAGQGASAGTVIKRYTSRTISSDGSRIVFASPVNDDSGGNSETDLYLRENGTTIQVNADERTVAPDPPDAAPATFWTASTDLSRIFFTSTEQLTDDDEEAGSRDLYMYDANLPPEHPHNLTRLGVDAEPDDGMDANVEGAIGVSEDGDYVYFYSTNQLIDDGVPGETVDHCDMGEPCIYLWHGGAIAFVGHTSSGERLEILGDTNWLAFDPKASRVTPDGRQLVFLSDGTSGEPYDHGSDCGAAGSDGDRPYFESTTPGCAELYLFEATANGGAGELTCVSCNPGGVHTTATEARIDLKTATTAASTSHLNRVVSDDGRFVFFSTGEPLVPEDTNGAIYDAYQYDTVTDEVNLISTGDSPHHAFFLDASGDGRDVFFRTREQLTGWDTDQQVDVYDARIGGGFADPVVTQPCQGGACQGPQGAGMTLPSLGTATFEDAGGERSRRAVVFHALDLGSRKLKRWARTGVVTLLVRISDAGRVAAKVRGRVDGRSRLVASEAKRVRGGGTVRLKLRLTNAARAQLRASGRLRVAIRVAHSRSDATQQAHATLIAAP